MDNVIDISKTKVCYDLPNSKDPKIFGPDFWAVFHDVANRIPCDGCREETVSFEIFHHDLKNYDLGKPLHDKVNFTLWVEKISAIKQERQKKKGIMILGYVAAVVTAILIIVIIKTK